MVYILTTPTPEAIRSLGVLAYLTPAKREQVQNMTPKQRERELEEIGRQIEREKKNSPKVRF